jgi:hypothetical protein
MIGKTLGPPGRQAIPDDKGIGVCRFHKNQHRPELVRRTEAAGAGEMKQQ